MMTNRQCALASAIGVALIGTTTLGQSRSNNELLDDINELLLERQGADAVDSSLFAAGRLPDPFEDEDFFGYPERVELGELLFYDKILSGNMNISCATCHHGLAGTGDAVSLPVGEGGLGLGPARDVGFGASLIHERVPRNAPPVFNLGAREFTTMFHDGRIEVDPSQPSGFLSPAGDDLPLGFEHVIEVQAMFPVTSGAEMAGQPGENPIADAAAIGDLAGPNGVWALLAQRLQGIPEYVDLFIAAFPDVNQASDITYQHAAKAIGSFEAVAWRFDDSPFDRYLRGERLAMTVGARRGMHLFYKRNSCAECHAGVLQTDQQFYAIGMPQFGPGKGDNQPGYSDGRDDFGRERVTLSPADRFRFRTPTLRNVALTGPWGHDGAYNTLRGVVMHHLDPAGALEHYDTSQATLAEATHLGDDFAVQNDPARRGAIADAIEIDLRHLSDRDVDHIVEFLQSLTDWRAVTNLRDDVPNTVPSGLPVGD